ncbi:hypothetical protein WJX73_005604 [Symbiochloris irregularis]|uniref:ATP-grasp domain-containing protein n=1 Tax=Symbiochloris irregularis TaxID=706552 RepID=A0AAW1P4D2_9CHLO
MLKLGSPALTATFLGPSSLGSLPPRLSLADRAAVSQSTPMSPSLAAIHSIPPAKLAAPTAEGRRLRRRLLRGTVVVVIVAGYQGKRFIYERAKELGVRLVILDADDSWASELVDAGIVEKFYVTDLSDQDTVFDNCMAGIRRAEREIGQVDGVLSFWELSQPLVSRLAERLGLPANPPEAVDSAREKQRTREVMGAAGLPTPKNTIIRSPKDLAKAAAHVGFPAVLKPISGAASLGVIRVNSEPDLHTLYTQVCKEVASVTRNAEGGLETKSVAPNEEVIEEQHTGQAYVAQRFMLETYLDGPEVDVDIALSQGDVIYGAVTDNWPTIEPYFNETGSNCPSILPHQQQMDLCDLAVASVKALGFEEGVLHVELKYTSHGPQLIEINARMGGGPVHMINHMVWGVDLVEEQLLSTVGIPSRPYLARSAQVQLAENSINAKATGRLQRDDFCEEWDGQEDVVYCRPLVKAGDSVTSVEDGLPTWVCEVMVTKPTMEKALEYVRKVESDIDSIIKITPAAQNARAQQAVPDCLS